MPASSQRPWSLPPPPDSYQKYGSKPLPPTPQRISLFDTPPRRAPQVPKLGVDGHIGASNPSQIKAKPKRRSMLGGFAGSGRRGEAPPKLETDRLPPPTVTRLTTPTYHSSDRKISQLMGLEPLAKPISSFSFGQPRDDEYIVSPMSSTSSYADDLVDKVSDLDELDSTHQSVRDSSLWPGPLVLQKSGSGSGDQMIDGANPRASQRSSMARADETDALRRHQINRSSGIEFHEQSPPRHPTPPSRSRDQSTGSLDRQPNTLSLTWEPREGFSSRAARSDTRKPAPPPPAMRAHSRDSDGERSASRGSDRSFGTGNHPLKTPYPPPSKKLGPNESGWDTDSDDEKERRPGSSLGAMASKLVKKVKPFRRDQGIVEITSREYRSGRLAPGGMSTGSSASASVTSVRSSGSAGGTAGYPGLREHVILTNRARDADGPDTPAVPPTIGLLQRTQGALVDAMKTAGIQSKSDRKRENLKGKIRVIPEGYPVYQGSNGEESRSR
ncbi:hypothetical protein MAPG_06708 [Magnaporthiopsis poae ATCC 64411]|uniref:Uncharacterized protein n=1 Tax=Magnaporthiopsis poae (strain ATCC 64411 / 73-15) TaxID=644358 RepID=A0A0C4E2R8_MAGP6|nr:hypothetical protein MAPG_06708 [Magnaporthiopsis poae ATCC 64411]